MSNASYGTAFEKLSDDERSAVTKKPKGIHEEIVTDERGRRRFHGAFSGGFSAGYFNTVGSKHGWVPQMFKSSRDKRAEKASFGAEDFMDEEDFGEFGIAAKKIRTKADFLETIAIPGESRQLAWERSTTQHQQADDAAMGSNIIASKLSEILRPASDSLGVRLMKKMGWKEGKGIGPRMSKRLLERQKVVDAKGRGVMTVIDEESIKEVEAHMPTAEFAPDDVVEIRFTPKENTHGLGYNPLQDKGVLAQSYGTITSGLKLSKRGKGIRGQAFGVGAYEDDDEDIYTNYDLTQYDFEVKATTSAAAETPIFDWTFVLAKQERIQRKFFPAKQPPKNFRAQHKPFEMKIEKLPEKISQLYGRLNAFQRAKFLGDRNQSTLDLLDEREKCLLERSYPKATSDKKVSIRDSRERTEVEPFEEEPIKAHRFRKYVHYLKSGLNFPPPHELTRLEWEKELEVFNNALTPELRSLLPEVRARQQPLAKIDYAQPIVDQLKSRFQKESADVDEHTKHLKDSQDRDRQQLVRTKMFGEMTRNKYQWHPAKDLCKRFNVPNPYPESALVGVLELQKRPKTSSFDIGSSVLSGCNQGLPDTAEKLKFKEQRKGERTAEVKNEPPIKVDTHHTRNEKASWELLKALFNESASSSSEDDEEETAQKNREEPSPQKTITGKEKQTNLLPSSSEIPTQFQTNGENKRSEAKSKVITVLDLVEDDDVFGPVLPPQFSKTPANNANEMKTKENDHISLSSDSADSFEMHRKRHHSKRKEHRHKDKRRKIKKSRRKSRS